MRYLIFPLLLLPPLYSHSQSSYKDPIAPSSRTGWIRRHYKTDSSGPSSNINRWHSGGGLSMATVSFQQNGAGGFTFPVRYDLLQSDNSSLSIGTHLKLGTEDKYGVGFPIILAFLLSGQPVDPSNIGNSDSSHSGTIVCLFSDIPLLLHYNWGLGSKNMSDRRFGLYAGGGISCTITGYTNGAGNEHSTSFYGWVGNIGVRFARDKDLGFSMTKPMEGSIGPINNPILYQVTFTWMSK